MRLVRKIRPYLDQWLFQIKHDLYPKSPIDMGYIEQMNHLTPLYCTLLVLHLYQRHLRQNVCPSP